MPGSEFFRRLGLFVIDRFLDSAECARVCADMDTAGAESAGVTDSSGQDYMVDGDFRRAKMANDAEIHQVAGAIAFTGPPATNRSALPHDADGL